MIFGVTGSRNGLTDAQLERLYLRFGEGEVDELHHGACVGADELTHGVAVEFESLITAHPPLKLVYAMDLDALAASPRTVVLPRKEYLARDRDIVDAAQVLIGFPDGPRRPHSGTWYTIDYAMKRRIPTTIYYPDGWVEHHC